MKGVIQLDAARISGVLAQRSEFGVVAAEVADGTNNALAGIRGMQVRMALCASGIYRGSKPKSALMLNVARRTGWREGLVRVMHRCIVTGEACLVRDALKVPTGLPQMA